MGAEQPPRPETGKTLIKLGLGIFALKLGYDYLQAHHLLSTFELPQTVDPTHPHTSDISIYPSGHYPDYGHNGIPLHGAIPHEQPNDPNGWGPYYNQRDTYWANMPLNGQHHFPMWQYGCYASAYAMVAAHYGVRVGLDNHLITPADVAQNPHLFDPHNPQLMYAKEPISGHPETLHSFQGQSSQQAIAYIEGQWEQGHQVIIGLHNDTWNTDHFVVVKGIMTHTDGEVDLVINDPDHPNGMNVPMAAYYLSPTWKIIEAKIYA